MAFKRALYPSDWKQIRQRILERSRGRCEKCGVRQYAVGYRDREGTFHATGGNQWHDAAGNGELPYGEARAGVRLLNETAEGFGPAGEKGIVIVLTCAHVIDSDPRNCDPANLAMLCQACHLRIDRPHHMAVQRRNRQLKRQRLQPTLPLEEER